MNRLVYSIRWKLLFVFLLSIGFSVVSLGFLYGVVLFIKSIGYPSFNALLYLIYSQVGITPSLLTAGCVLFIIFFFILTRKSIRYLLQITEAVQHIAAGHFDRRVPVNARDELGELAENMNRMAEKLKSSIEEERRAERTKSELITSVSHDLRTPLTSITGYLGLIEQDRYRDEVELRHYIQIASEKAQRLNVLINDLFEYTRISGGGMKLKSSSINLVEMLGQLAVHYRLQMENAGLVVRTQFTEDKLIIPADGDKLVRVFENLFVNAMHYGAQGKFVDVSARRDGHEAVVEVVNYGEQIPASDLPRIFERFYRVEKSRSESTGGSGLGLAIAKNIVELHGGTISAASDPDRTCFEVRLKIYASPGTGLAPQA